MTRGTSDAGAVAADLAAAQRAGLARHGTVQLEGDLRLGSLEARLAVSDAEVEAAQALRYRIFYEEMAARP